MRTTLWLRTGVLIDAKQRSARRRHAATSGSCTCPPTSELLRFRDAPVPRHVVPHDIHGARSEYFAEPKTSGQTFADADRNGLQFGPSRVLARRDHGLWE